VPPAPGVQVRESLNAGQNQGAAVLYTDLVIKKTTKRAAARSAAGTGTDCGPAKKPRGRPKWVKDAYGNPTGELIAGPGASCRRHGSELKLRLGRRVAGRAHQSLRCSQSQGDVAAAAHSGEVDPREKKSEVCPCTQGTAAAQPAAAGLIPRRESLSSGPSSCSRWTALLFPASVADPQEEGQILSTVPHSWTARCAWRTRRLDPPGSASQIGYDATGHAGRVLTSRLTAVSGLTLFHRHCTWRSARWLWPTGTVQ
jgi:hypothetical protein